MRVQMIVLASMVLVLSGCVVTAGTEGGYGRPGGGLPGGHHGGVIGGGHQRVPVTMIEVNSNIPGSTLVVRQGSMVREYPVPSTIQVSWDENIWSSGISNRSDSRNGSIRDTRRVGGSIGGHGGVGSHGGALSGWVYGKPGVYVEPNTGNVYFIGEIHARGYRPYQFRVYLGSKRTRQIQRTVFVNARLERERVILFPRIENRGPGDGRLERRGDYEHRLR